jgi:hypothetical protein
VFGTISRKPVAGLLLVLVSSFFSAVAPQAVTVTVSSPSIASTAAGVLGLIGGAFRVKEFRAMIVSSSQAFRLRCVSSEG